MTVPEIGSRMIIAELVTNFVTAVSTLLLTLATILDAVGTTRGPILSPVRAIRRAIA